MLAILRLAQHGRHTTANMTLQQSVDRSPKMTDKDYKVEYSEDGAATATQAALHG